MTALVYSVSPNRAEETAQSNSYCRARSSHRLPHLSSGSKVPSWFTVTQRTPASLNITPFATFSVLSSDVLVALCMDGSPSW